MADHDNGYKLLFSHAAVCADVLRGFVKERWVGELELETLERVEGSYVSDGLRSRESDMVWRVRWRGRSLYIYVLLEFQSTVDDFMAIRAMTYLGLLYQDLIRGKALTASGKLPPVFMLVLYNGKRPWDAPVEVSDLIEELPGGLEAYRPRLRYALLDELQVPDLELEPERNLAAALFRLEKSRDLDDLRQQMGRLGLNEKLDPEIWKSVRTWLVKVLIPNRFPGKELEAAESLKEFDTMLAERVREWTQEWKKEGLQEGLQDLLLVQLEERFGPISQEVRQRVLSIQDRQELTDLGRRLLTASSLDELGLGS